MESNLVTLILAFLCLVPTLMESYLDRHGETKRDKLWDGLILVGYSVLLAFGAWWLGYRPLSVIGLILGFRVLIFDYLVQYLLIKNKVIVGHWFTYNGKTSFIDRLISGVHPVLRFAARVIVFLASIFLFFA